MSKLDAYNAAKKAQDAAQLIYSGSPATNPMGWELVCITTCKLYLAESALQPNNDEAKRLAMTWRTELAACYKNSAITIPDYYIELLTRVVIDGGLYTVKQWIDAAAKFKEMCDTCNDMREHFMEYSRMCLDESRGIAAEANSRIAALRNV